MTEQAPSELVEPVVYRNEEEFNTALDKAAEAIEGYNSSQLLGNVIWWGLIVLGVLILIADGAFGWPVRYVGGVDLVIVLGLIIVGLILWYHAWLRHRRRRIIKHRLCLRCGQSLADEPVDEHGTGACPRCERAFDVTEYRRPADNCGRVFAGYVDRDHFDKAIYEATEHLKRHSALGLEGQLLGYYSIAVIAMGIARLFGWKLLNQLVPGPLPDLAIAFIVMLIWGWSYQRRVSRFGPTLVRERLCWNCGYSLLRTPLDDGIGRCPECATEFCLEQYDAPPDLETD